MTKRAASIAPRAKTLREYAMCFTITASSSPGENHFVFAANRSAPYRRYTYFVRVSLTVAVENRRKIVPHGADFPRKQFCRARRRVLFVAMVSLDYFDVGIGKPGCRAADEGRNDADPAAYVFRIKNRRNPSRSP